MTDQLTCLLGSWLEVFEPPQRMTVSEWANEFRWLSPENCSNPGRYSTDLTPYAIEWMDSVLDPTSTGTVLMVASQLSKTETANNVLGYFIDVEPSPVLMVQPTVDLGEAWSKERLAPMVRDCPSLRDKVHDVKSRDSSNTILHKSFPGGNLAIAGANAPSGLASRPRRVVLLDEVDRYPPSAGTEGDPCSLAIRRTETFWNAVVFITSTPTVKGRSRIEAEWETSDKRRWHCPCPRCGYSQVLAWAQVRHDEEDGSDAWYQCAGCEEKLTDEERRKMVRAGKWVAEHPERTVRGYHLNGIASLFRHKKGYRSRLHQMVAEQIAAKKKGKESLKTWVNTFLAETWEEEGEAVEWGPLMQRAENWGEFPDGGLLLTAGGDVQGDRVEVEIVAWGEHEESWSIGYEVIMGDLNNPETQAALDEVLSRKWKHPTGVEVGISAALIDSGHKASSVYKFTRRREVRRIFAVKGKGGPGVPLLSRPTRRGKERAALFTVGTDTAKDIVYSRLNQAEIGPGYMHFPSDRDESWYRQITAEQRVTRWKDGAPYSKFENPSKARNEALDCRVYALAALQLVNVNWSKLKESFITKPKSEEAAKPKERRSRRGGGWVNGW